MSPKMELPLWLAAARLAWARQTLEQTRAHGPIGSLDQPLTLPRMSVRSCVLVSPSEKKGPGFCERASNPFIGTLFFQGQRPRTKSPVTTPELTTSTGSWKSLSPYDSQPPDLPTSRPTEPPSVIVSNSISESPPEPTQQKKESPPPTTTHTPQWPPHHPPSSAPRAPPFARNSSPPPSAAPPAAAGRAPTPAPAPAARAAPAAALPTSRGSKGRGTAPLASRLCISGTCPLSPPSSSSSTS